MILLLVFKGRLSLYISAIVIWGKVWKPEKYKMIIVLLLFGALLSCIGKLEKQFNSN